MCIGVHDVTTKSKAVFPGFKARMEYPGYNIFFQRNNTGILLFKSLSLKDVNIYLQVVGLEQQENI